jgi:uncharacterized protein
MGIRFAFTSIVHMNFDGNRDNPYRSEIALAHSSYLGEMNGELVSVLDGRAPTSTAREVHRALKSFVIGRHPCAGARAVIQTNGYRFGVYPEIGGVEATGGIARDLWSFVRERATMKTEFAAFIAVFDCEQALSELEFEAVVWRQLNALHEMDEDPYSGGVSSDAADPQFGFSFASTAFFIVGLHPRSSRIARRFAWPALVFNAHSQFDALAEQGIYDRFQALVRKRDLALQGSLNPNLAEFGEKSEARQYSGRAVEDDWRCPFRAKPDADRAKRI